MARRLAVVISHAPGLRGTPSAGHCSSAATSASCASSSATPTSRTSLVSPAMSRARLDPPGSLDRAVGVSGHGPRLPHRAIRRNSAHAARGFAHARGFALEPNPRLPGCADQFPVTFARRFSTASCCSAVKFSPKSSAWKTRRISMLVCAPTPGRWIGQRLNHSRHSSSDFISTR